ncbi:hypothetical protein RMN57_00050 [Kitasatospora sp. CM 4170]|uniref:Uncharacterized protein n=1 Tax=Kitasatospora aburaviensis TaxID=67265 RepID=A0ABW1F9U1_9ACTN|nr:hypothetical protein [Kitasatospora sp. CM 4170]WNM43203.1 hypothetical protein RMN57_00050 [Kitasatospora sp. CM 4170]
MSLVQIEGSEEVLRAVQLLPELHMVRSSLETRPDDQYKVAAYASDQAVEAAIAEGARVTVLLSSESAADQHARMSAVIGRGYAERGEV